MLYLDLDGFKPVNDEYGHDVGDAVLRTIATRLRGCLRPADTAARLGGDEFAVLLGGPLDAQGISRVVDRIRAQFDVPVDLGEGHVAKIGASIGIAVGSVDTEDADRLIRQSDIAMYAAKRSGGGCSYYEPGMGDPTSAREEQVAALTRAIRDGELFTVYQPLINLRTGRPTGAEALVRWQHPEDGVARPRRVHRARRGDRPDRRDRRPGAPRGLPPGAPAGSRPTRTSRSPSRSTCPRGSWPTPASSARSPRR